MLIKLESATRCRAPNDGMYLYDIIIITDKTKVVNTFCTIFNIFVQNNYNITKVDLL